MMDSNMTTQSAKKTELLQDAELETKDSCEEAPAIIDEIRIEELAIDGICGVY